MSIQRINETSLRPPTAIQQQPVALINFLLNNAGAIEKGPAERERECAGVLVQIVKCVIRKWKERSTSLALCIAPFFHPSD
jgi:hypothetical protein